MNANQANTGLSKVAQNVYAKKWSFLVVFSLMIFVVLSICITTGFIPDSSSDDTVSLGSNPFGGVSSSTLLASAAEATPIVNGSPVGAGTASSPTGQINLRGDLPVKIVIPSVSVDAPVANPSTLNVDALDNYLSYGAARYPTSATLDQQGNVIIFGHSSYLPVIINQHYKTFDGIQNLAQGAKIDVYSKTEEYVYAVETVEKENATSGYQIPLTTTGHTLTIATCNSFATKSDRFIITATLVGSYPLGN